MSRPVKVDKSGNHSSSVLKSSLLGGGKMGKLLSQHNWSKTALGPIDKWSESTIAVINIMLRTPMPAVLLWGTEGVMLFNDAFVNFASARSTELLGTEVIEAWPHIADFHRDVLRQCLKGKSITFKNKPLKMYRDKVLEDVWLDLSYSPVINEEGKAVGTFGVVVDNTPAVVSRKRQIASSKFAKETEKHFKFMAETLPLKIFTTTATGKITYYNPQWAEYTGVPVETLLRTGVQHFLHPDDLELSMTSWRKSLKSGDPVQNEQRLLRADGQYRRHISYARPMRDESGKIIEWFGSMTDIEDVLEAIIQKEKLELMTLGLKEQRKQLMAVNNAKDEFIALSSHQLRTPATAVKQYIALVLDDFFGTLNAEQKQSLQTAYDSNERQLNIINDLLKTAQLDAIRHSLNKHQKTLSSIISEIITEYKTPLKMNKQHVVFSENDEPTKVLVDVNELKLVFINLLENAMKYSYPGSFIKIAIKKKFKFIEVSFTDQGVGIKKEDIGRIFDKFTRINNDLSDTVNGSGLGLYWVKKIIKLHHGNITVTSTLGVGSTFTVRIPL